MRMGDKMLVASIVIVLTLLVVGETIYRFGFGNLVDYIKAWFSGDK